MSAHTPGPWQVAGQYHHATFVCSQGNAADVIAKCDGGECSKLPHEANARLIACAPELLEALESLVAFREPDSMADQLTDVRLCVDHAEAWERARAAIAKAQP